MSSGPHAGRGVIDADKLIEQVKKRPALYDSRQSIPPKTKKQHWVSIAKEMYSDVWEASDSNEREALVKVLQVRWKSLRDAFSRSRKMEKQGSNKKYYYDKQLSFLDDIHNSSSPVNSSFLQDTDTSAQDETKDESMQSDDEDNDPSYEDENASSNNVKEEFFEYSPDLEMPQSSTSGSFVQTRKMTKDSKSKDKDSGGTATTTSNTTATTSSSKEKNASSNKSTAGGTAHAHDSSVQDLIREVVKMRKEDSEDDRMGNKKFLLSLLPFLAQMPDDINLEVRLQLMNVLQTYSSRESLMRM